MPVCTSVWCHVICNVNFCQISCHQIFLNLSFTVYLPIHCTQLTNVFVYKRSISRVICCKGYTCSMHLNWTTLVWKFNHSFHTVLRPLPSEVSRKCHKQGQHFRGKKCVLVCQSYLIITSEMTTSWWHCSEVNE